MTTRRRGPSEVQTRVVNKGERAADEVQRDEPSAADPCRGRRQGNQTPRDRCQRLVRREHNRAGSIRYRDGPGLFAHRELKSGGQIIQRHKFLVVDGCHRQRPSSFPGEQRDGSRTLARETHDDDDGDPEHGGRKDDLGKDGQRTVVQWRVSNSEIPIVVPTARSAADHFAGGVPNDDHEHGEQRQEKPRQSPDSSRQG
jgi:hypothetical protein